MMNSPEREEVSNVLPDLTWIARATERIAKLQPGTNDGVIAMIIREEWAMGTQ